MQDETSVIGEVLRSKTCKRILEALKEGPKTETEISEGLKMPLSTVHYNIEKIMKAGLVNANSFHYSKKGKEVKHYRLVKKKEIRLFNKTISISIILTIIAGISVAVWHFTSIRSNSQLTEIAKNNIYTSSASGTAQTISQANHPNLLLGLLIILGIMTFVLLFLWFKKKRRY